MDKQIIIDKIQENTEVLRKVKAEYYKEHFFEFNRDVLKWPDIYEPLHRRVCDFIQNNVKDKKLLLLLPRGTFKSSIVTIGYPLWRIAQNPQDRILVANATYPMVVQFMGQIKNHLTKNETFREIFGDLSGNADSWREDRIAVSTEKSYEQKEPTVWALGMGSNTTGSHFNIAILDDLVNRDNITTREQIEKTINFYKDTLDLVDINAFGKKEVILIGTCWHQSDLYSWIEDPENNLVQDFEVLKLPAYTGEWGKGELLFPERLNWKTMEELKRQQGSSHFSSQYMLDPVPSESAVFKSEYFKYYDESDIRGLQLNKFIAIDPAISERKEADYTAMVCVGVDINNTWYLLDVWRDKVQPKGILDQLFIWDQKWKPISVGIETTAYQKSLQYSAYDEMKKRNKMIPLNELKHTDSTKDQRIRALEPRYQMRAILHNKALEGTAYLEDELLRFDKGKNDDLIDALSSILEIAFPPKNRSERKPIKRNVYPA